MSVPRPHDEPAVPRRGAAPDEPAAPHVHVVRGAPDDVELAALVAGLVASSSATPAHDEPAPAAAWTDRRRTLHPTPVPTPGPATWRWSLHP